MAVTLIPNFPPEVPYYTGQGCLVCGSNIGPQVWTGIDDRVDGRISLCFDHAREVGRAAGLVEIGPVEDLVDQANQAVEVAAAERRQAQEAQARAAEDREHAEKTRVLISDLLANPKAGLPKKPAVKRTS